MSNFTPELLLNALSESIKRDLDKVFEEEKKRVLERLENEKDKTIASTMLSLSKHLSIQTMGETITLRIEKRERT